MKPIDDEVSPYDLAGMHGLLTRARHENSQLRLNRALGYELANAKAELAQLTEENARLRKQIRQG